MRLRVTGMTAALAVGVTAAVGLATAAGAYLYTVHHFQTLIESARSTALAQGQLMRAALEHQMLENDRSLIERMVTSFGNEERVSGVMIVDREGHTRHSSLGPDAPDIDLSSPTCQACHRLPPEERTSSRVIETREGQLLRTVIPLPNREECHRCHDPRHRINGVLIVDLDAGGIRAMMNRDLRWLAAGSGGLALLLVVAIAIVLRVVVVRRLQRFETTARQIAAGDLERRVPVKGSDTIAWLGHEFNSMADSMTRLLKEVGDQREQLETVINGINDGIVVLDVERNVVAANDAFLRRRGCTREELVGASCHDGSTATCGASDCPTMACLQSGSTQVRICERRLPNGQIIWEEVQSSPIRRDSGRIVQVVEVWRDISKRRAAEARLAESHRLASLGMLASGFSHELNTPLATILTCVESIQRSATGSGGADGERRKRIADSAGIAREQLLRCRGITQNFLRLSRGQRPQVESVNLASALTAVARLIEPTARAHGVSVRTGPVPDNLHARVNEGELQHVLLNLMLNAIQASERGGRIDLEVDGGKFVRIRVKDRGCGIAPEILSRIFDPFYSGKRGGTGLGLFLSQEFVHHWGGSISVDSSPGRGSTFEVVLPSVGGVAAAGTAS